jgi:hypothetical protein
MTYCLCQPRPTDRDAAVCRESNFLPRAHVLMMKLPARELKRDRLLVDSLVALKLVRRAGSRLYATPLGNRLFKNNRMRCAFPQTVRQRGCRGVFELDRKTFDVCDARPDTWRPAPGSISYRNPCTW